MTPAQVVKECGRRGIGLAWKGDKLTFRYRHGNAPPAHIKTVVKYRADEFRDLVPREDPPDEYPGFTAGEVEMFRRGFTAFWDVVGRPTEGGANDGRGDGAGDTGGVGDARRGGEGTAAG